jgi:hypothetical protein
MTHRLPPYRSCGWDVQHRLLHVIVVGCSPPFVAVIEIQTSMRFASFPLKLSLLTVGEFAEHAPTFSRAALKLTH